MLPVVCRMRIRGDVNVANSVQNAQVGVLNAANSVQNAVPVRQKAAKCSPFARKGVRSQTGGFRGQDGNLDVWSSLGASDGFGGQILLQACLLRVPHSLGSPACASQVPENPPISPETPQFP